MSEANHSTALTIIKSVHLSRDAVIFSIAGTVSYFSGSAPASLFLWLLLLDLPLFVLFWVMKPTWEPLVYMWAALNSILLLFHSSVWFGYTPITGGVIALILLCLFELLAIMKVVYDILRNQVRSWTSEAEGANTS